MQEFLKFHHLGRTEPKLKGELDVKLGRGWQKYDPVIKKGRPQSYKKLFQELDSDSQESANALIKYFNEGIPEDAPVSPVIHLILILCVCEVGRGYGQAPDNMLAYAHDLIDYPNGAHCWTQREVPRSSHFYARVIPMKTIRNNA